MQPCPNCGELVDAGRTICPNCGRDLTLPTPTAAPPSENSPAVWPPPPEGFVAPFVPPPVVGKLITGKSWGDYVLGLAAGIGSTFAFGVGLLLIPILYFTLRRTYPMFARGIGHVGLFLVVAFLGLLAVCFYGISHSTP